MGRPALDADARELLEQQYPEIAFDWDQILREPPQAPPEHEAARRKEQRDARDARRKRKKPVETAEGAEEPRRAETREPEQTEAAKAHAIGDGDLQDDEDLPEQADVLSSDSSSPVGEPVAEGAKSSPDAARRRRRRRRRRRGGGEPSSNPPPQAPPNDSV